MNHNKSALAIAVAATLGGASTAADAATYVATLTDVKSYSNNGTSAGNITSSTAKFSYNDVTNLLTQTGGTFNVRFTITPTTTLFRHTITGLVIGNGAAALAATYACQEGNFGGNVGAHLCGNYNFGVNFTNESTVTWGPLVAFGRTQGGDDVIVGPQQSLNTPGYSNFTTQSFDGSTLVMTNAGTGTCSAGLCSGYDWTLSTVSSPDADGDGIADGVDNCSAKSNASQCDSDLDGYGNHCDGDFNQNLVTNSQDYVLFRQQLGQPSPARLYNSRDLNCNGVVNSQDYVLFRGLLGSAPGPSNAL